MSTEAPLLANEADHPQEVVEEHGDRRIVVMDSARYVDARNRGTDVVVPASYLGVFHGAASPACGHRSRRRHRHGRRRHRRAAERHGLAGGSSWTAPITPSRPTGAIGVEVGMDDGRHRQAGGRALTGSVTGLAGLGLRAQLPSTLLPLGRPSPIGDACTAPRRPTRSWT